MAAHCSWCMFITHCCVCALGWVKCRAPISSMGHHTWQYITLLLTKTQHKFHHSFNHQIYTDDKARQRLVLVTEKRFVNEYFHRRLRGEINTALVCGCACVCWLKPCPWCWSLWSGGSSAFHQLLLTHVGLSATLPPGALLEHSNWRSGRRRAGTHISCSIIKFIWRAEFICPEGLCLTHVDRGPYTFIQYMQKMCAVHAEE